MDETPAAGLADPFDVLVAARVADVPVGLDVERDLGVDEGVEAVDRALPGAGLGKAEGLAGGGGLAAGGVEQLLGERGGGTALGFEICLVGEHTPDGGEVGVDLVGEVLLGTAAGGGDVGVAEALEEAELGVEAEDLELRGAEASGGGESEHGGCSWRYAGGGPSCRAPNPVSTEGGSGLAGDGVHVLRHGEVVASVRDGVVVAGLLLRQVGRGQPEALRFGD
ncbi:hypothetical protein SCALM49S_02504 [Streptomyces californicus]